MVITQKATQNEQCKKRISELLLRLWLEISGIEHFILAFIHRSIVNERADYAPEHNERLEFLWDAVLELVITQKLFEDYPLRQEGEMTDMRSALVRGRNLSQVAKNLGFQEYLLLGKWEEKSWGRENDYILANTLEAFIGAIFLEFWIKIASDFIEKYIYTTLSGIEDQRLLKDYKTLLQEYTQAHKDITPHYEVLEENGPDHDKDFLVAVYLKTQQIGTWNGSSKKKAQEDAAKNAYITLTS